MARLYLHLRVDSNPHRRPHNLRPPRPRTPHHRKREHPVNACTSCGRTQTRNGAPLNLATRGKHIGWCLPCRKKLNTSHRATQNTTPCKKCGRTHARTGTPLDIKKSGELAGCCTACRKAARSATGPPEHTAAEDHNLRVYQNYITRRRARIARRERIKNHAA